MSDGWSELIDGLRAGDAAAARRFWQRYGPMLHEVAERRLAGALRRRVGAEDVVQSVCRTFLRRVQGGELVVEDAERLWQLLCAIAVNKARMQARFHQQKKRALDAETPLDVEGGTIDLVAGEPSPEALVVADELEAEIGALDEEERTIVLLKIADHTNDEIAAKLGCSERTVRRLITKVREQLAHRLAG